MPITHRSKLYALVVMAALPMGACSSLPIADYSLEAYKNATSLKAETAALVAKSSQPYARHAEEVDALNVKIDAAYEFAAGIPSNQLSAEQWRLLRDPDGNLYGGFVVFWRARGSVSGAFRDEFAIQIDEAFDEIICLEANKQALVRC